VFPCSLALPCGELLAYVERLTEHTGEPLALLFCEGQLLTHVERLTEHKGEARSLVPHAERLVRRRAP